MISDGMINNVVSFLLSWFPKSFASISLDQLIFGCTVIVTVTLFLVTKMKLSLDLNNKKFAVNESFPTTLSTSSEDDTSIIFKTAINADQTPPNKLKTQIVRQSVQSNTPFDIDEFKLRMYKTGFVVKRIKNGVGKLRCLIISEHCEFCMHKDVKSVLTSTWGLYLKPYVKMPMKEMVDCFQCDGSLNQSFIMQFHGLSLHFTAVSALDAYYLVTGFKALVSRMKYDQYFVSTYGEALSTEPSKFSCDPSLRRLACNKATAAFQQHRDNYQARPSSPRQQTRETPRSQQRQHESVEDDHSVSSQGTSRLGSSVASPFTTPVKAH